MNKKTIFIIIALIAAALVGWGAVVFFGPAKQAPAPTAQISGAPGGTTEEKSASVPAATEQPDIFIVASALRFGPAYFVVKEGKPLKVKIISDSNHTFTIDELGVNELLKPGENNFTFTPNKSGVFRFYCSVPGHRQAGMFGDISVEPAGSN